MSVTFYPSFFANPLIRYVPIWRCNCEENREVSLPTCDVCEHLQVNFNNVNARDLLDHLALSTNDDLVGQVKAVDLSARCQRKLWPTLERVGPKMDDVLNHPAESAEVHINGRAHCYLRERTLALLGIVRRALTETNFHRDDVFISWG